MKPTVDGGIDFIDQAADRITLGPPATDKQKLAMELAIAGHCRDLADQRLLTEAFGLTSYEHGKFAVYQYGRLPAAGTAAPVAGIATGRRAAPAAYRRGRKPGGRHG